MVQAADIKRLLDAFEQSDWQEIRLSIDGTDILISANDNATSLSSKTPPQAGAAVTASEEGAETSRQTQSPIRVARAAPPAANEVPSGHAVRSASPGIFWRSPAPGAAPFIEVGQRVEADTVVCIVEVMKLMNRVLAGVAGTVVAILVENSGKVARDQALLIIDPDT